MKAKDIKLLYNETLVLLSELNLIAVEKGYMLDNDLESGLFNLLIDEDKNEIVLLKNRIITAIGKMKDGTFKLPIIEEELLQATA